MQRVWNIFFWGLEWTDGSSPKTEHLKNLNGKRKNIQTFQENLSKIDQRSEIRTQKSNIKRLKGQFSENMINAVFKWLVSTEEGTPWGGNSQKRELIPNGESLDSNTKLLPGAKLLHC